MSLVLVFLAIAIVAASGLPGLWARRRSSWGEHVALSMVLCGALLGLVGAGLGLQGESAHVLALPLPLAGSGAGLAVDALSAFFLIPIFVIGGLGAVYGLVYWRQADHATNGRKVRLFWGWLVAGMGVLVLARNSLVFLLGWEVMALSAFFLISAQDGQAEVRKASWVYLIATHFGTLCLFAMFVLLRQAAGTFDLQPVPVEQASLGLLTAIYFLALIGFGLKAGIMPLHFWLPSAHANAPSHVSAILSGVMIKMGIYGLVRIFGLLPAPPVAWGTILLVLGAVSGVLGVVFAIGQHDLKRLLAYHSVENIGIIVMGLGLAMAGRSQGRTDWTVLGLAGCLLHVWNHGLFKSLLFFSAGSVVHATGTREMDQMGGLAKAMPRTALMFLIGALAICGLPPLNGFISELFIYLGLFRSMGVAEGPSWMGAGLAVPALAIIGALAVACFVKAYGVVFLGLPRGRASLHAHESPLSMIAPMAILAACCVLIGLAPFAVAPILNRVVESWTMQVVSDEMQLATLVPLTSISMMGFVFLALAASVSFLVLRVLRLRGVRRQGTWDCGYAQPTARMQYTASSFAQTLVGLFRWVLRPRVHRPEVSDPFPAAARFESHVEDIVLDGQILPFACVAERWLGRIRVFQQGLTHHYVLYILAAVLGLLAWAIPMDQVIARFFAR